jgi:hypothetical protein
MGYFYQSKAATSTEKSRVRRTVYMKSGMGAKLPFSSHQTAKEPQEEARCPLQPTNAKKHGKDSGDTRSVQAGEVAEV